MDILDQLRDAIDGEERRLADRVAGAGPGATLAILQSRDRRPLARAPVPDPITGTRLGDPGGNLALALSMRADQLEPAGTTSVGGWADDTLAACDTLALARVIRDHVVAGQMRLAPGPAGSIAASPTTRRGPASWRERADYDDWAARISGPAPQQSSPTPIIASMAHQPGYPRETVLGARSYGDYLDMLAALIVRVPAPGDGPLILDEWELATTIAGSTGRDVDVVMDLLDPFTLSADNADWHAAVPGIAAPPLVRLAAGQLALSGAGLTREPLLFLARELRRRDPEMINNAAVGREDVFRRDLYAVFSDRRFVTSDTRLRVRKPDGDLRTDIDAAIFDRKTGTLALFELKSQDPFARSAAERNRQRDYVLAANRQLSGTLAWVQRHGAGDLLQRIDARTAKTFRVQRVLSFVLGRYLIHFDDGPEPDRRAAWGTWPEVVRLANGSDANPLLSLADRLRKGEMDGPVPEGTSPRDLTIGDLRLTTFASSRHPG